MAARVKTPELEPVIYRWVKTPPFRALTGRRRVAEQPAAGEIDQENNRQYGQRQQCAVGHHDVQGGFAVSHRQKSLDEIPQRAAQKNGENEGSQGHLKDAFGQDENFERRGRRQNTGHEHAQEGVPLHPLLGPVRAGARVAMEERFAALFSDQIEPDAAGKGTERGHRAIVGHARGPLQREADDERVCDKGK